MSSFPQARPERNIRDVNEAKAVRKAEIERRCSELEPPLSTNILNHMDSFQAAIQISQPLTDHAWEVLKPRLLAQRPFAEKKEEEKIRQDELLQEEYRQRRQQEAQLKETREALDREWDGVQAPVRNKISALADEIIAENWSNGDSVSKDTSPKFAADVLVYVRERFYADILREDEAAKAAGEPVKVDQANEPPTRKLILENMKWLFDTKIKPLTENYQKELFLCNGCDGNFKFYGFEGVVQHFAAKHTTALSMGSVVVHWRAEWPEHPPFNPNPSAAKAAYYKIPTPVNSSMQAPPNSEVQAHTYPTGYGQPAEHNAPPPNYDNTQPALNNTYPAPYGAPQQNSMYQYPPAQAYPPYAQMPPPEHGQGAHFHPQQPYAATHYGYNGYPPVQYGQPAGPTYGTPYGQTHYPSFTQSQEYPRPGTHGQDPTTQYYSSGPIAPQTAAFPPRPAPGHPSGLTLDVYQKQLDELAKQAREVWFGTSGIKDIPQSVRIFVVIHQVASRFAAQFTNEPSLAMFIDGLDNHAKMRPVRSLNGLACKTCVNAGASAGTSQPFSAQSPVADRRLYTLPHLLNHFRSAHVDDAWAVKEPSAVSDPSKPNWKRDMIELPDITLIANLLSAPGMDDTKLGLVATVFPEAFPAPLPRMARGGNTGPVPPYKHEYPSHKASSVVVADQPRTFKNETRGEARQLETSYGAVQAPSPRGQSAEPPGEDEYDPHRPALLGKTVISESNPVHGWEDQQYQTPNGAPYSYYKSDGNFYGAKSEQFDQSFHQVQRDAQYTEHPRPNLVANFASNYVEDGAHLRGQQRNHHLNNEAYNENTQTVYTHVRGSSLRDAATPKQFAVRSASPSEAADQFLNNFAVSQAQHSGTLPQEKDPRSVSAWRDEAANQERQQIYNAVASLEKWKDSNNPMGQTADDRPTLDSIRAAQSISRAVDDLATSHRAASRSHNDDEYRPPSEVHISPTGSRSGPSPQPYTAQGPQHQTLVEPQYVKYDLGPRDDRAGSGHPTQELYYRSRSRSPQTAPAERTYYRARSPRNERRQESLYRVISPPMRQEPQVQRIVRDEYSAQPRYQYIEDRVPTEDRYGRRVEYVPVRYEGHGSAEPSRYVLAQPIEDPAPPPGYVRLEQGYGGQQIYERNGQMYRAETANYHPEPYRGPQIYAQDYRY